MRRLFLIILFGVLAIAALYMAAISKNVATGFVYVLFTMFSTFVGAYVAFEKSK